MGHLHGILALVGGNLNNDFQKSQIPGGLPGGGGMLKLRFDRYITVEHQSQHTTCFMINLTLKHIYNCNNLYSISNFVTNFGFTN